MQLVKISGNRDLFHRGILLSVFYAETFGDQGKVAADGIGAGVQTAQFRDQQAFAHISKLTVEILFSGTEEVGGGGQHRTAHGTLCIACALVPAFCAVSRLWSRVFSTTFSITAFVQ